MKDRETSLMLLSGLASLAPDLTWGWPSRITTTRPSRSFVAGVHHSALYHNNGNGTVKDVTVKSGLDASLNHPDPAFGPLWAITAVWVDVNNDGLLDLLLQITTQL